MLDIFYQKKQRRKGSLNRNFYVDYIGMDDKPGLKNLVGRRDKIQFAQTVKKYDRKYKVSIYHNFNPLHVVRIFIKYLDCESP